MNMLLRTATAGFLVLLLGPATALSSEPEACKQVRFSDVGWTDIKATTALASRVLEGLGYEPSEKLLTVPTTYAALSDKAIDIFLGNWMPTMAADRQPYLDDKSIEIIEPANLDGAKYTLAVPAYTFDAGLRSFADIAGFRDALGGKIYGIEPGNDGNRLILEMIDSDQFNLGGFELVASSEEGMLAEVRRAVGNNQPIVFLGWEPHPMNATFDIKYLADGDGIFGPGATVFTNIRAGYREECPNLGVFLGNLHFTVTMENEVMGAILDDGMDAGDAAEAWLKDNLEGWQGWLDGVTAFDGKPGLDAAKASLGM